MKTTDIPVIELSGTPRERGRIHGETAKPLIASLVESWRDDLGNFNLGNSGVKNSHPDTYLDQFLSQTNYLSAIKKWAPDLLEEAYGIAEGAGQDFQHILGLQLIDEEWVFGLRRGLNNPTTKCTAFAVPNQLAVNSYAGQNMDIPSWVEGHQVLLRVMPTANSPEALLFSIAGSIGLNGLNASGLGITCNALPQLAYSIDGLPVQFIVRSILAYQNIDQAEQFLHHIQHASGQNYILSAPGDMRCFECSGNQVVRYAPEDQHGRLFHTNHILINPDSSEFAEQITAKPNSSVPRLNSIIHRLGDPSRTVTLDDTKAALAAHDDPDNPVSRVINAQNTSSSIGYTAGSSIYEFSPLPRLHLAAGPPCETAFEVFEFNANI